jgi:hypothetical protein
VSVCPACAVPEIAGGEVFAGGEATLDPTGWLRTDTGTLPSEFFTEKTSLIVKPASALWTVYVFALVSAEQLVPVLEQRCHWSPVTDSTADPLQPPTPRTSTCPTWGAEVSGAIDVLPLSS